MRPTYRFGWPKRLSRCDCGHAEFVHRFKKGACLACPEDACAAYQAGGVNPVHRYMVAPARRQSYNGIMFDSKAECDYAISLDWRVKSGDLAAWKYHPLIHIYFADVHICDYELDFLLTHPNGTEEYVEVKGFPGEVWKLKWKMAKAYFKSKDNVRLTLIRV